LKSEKINGLPGDLYLVFEFFVDERLDWARGWRRDLRKHRPGPSFSSAKPKEILQREAEACGPAFFRGKTTASWFREARRCPRAPAVASNENLEGGAKFVKSYETAGYREPFGAYGPNAYDSAGILLEAISKAGVEDKAAMAKYIRGIKYRGLMGETTFDATGQTQNVNVSRFVGQDGKWVTWEDSAYAKGSKKLPTP